MAYETKSSCGLYSEIKGTHTFPLHTYNKVDLAYPNPFISFNFNKYHFTRVGPMDLASKI